MPGKASSAAASNGIHYVLQYIESIFEEQLYAFSYRYR